jgi:hypothetical protein
MEDYWAEVKKFIAEWHRPLELGDGYSEEEIQEAEARLGIRFPEALRGWYRWAGKWYADMQEQDRQVPLSDLVWEEDVLVFHVENQYVCEWAIRREAFDQSNPPVEDVVNKVLFTERLTDFMFGALCKEMYVGAFGERESEGCEGAGTGFAQVASLLADNLSVWQVRSGADLCYANHEALAVLSEGQDDTFWLFLLAKTEVLEEQYITLLGDGIDWEPYTRETLEGW